VVKNPIPAIQEATDYGTTEHTEHTEIRTSETSAAFLCVLRIPWSRIRSQRFKKQPIVEPQNTLNIRKSGRQKPRLLFRVFRVFRGQESDPSDSRSNRLWNHGTHRTHGNQDVRNLGCFSVCSAYSVVKNPIPAIQEATDCGNTEHTEHTEIRTSETTAAFLCVLRIRWLN
jgi:hypothetical protein